MIAFSLATSFCKIYEFSLNSETPQNLEYPVMSVFANRERIWFVVIYAFHYITNDFILLVLNFAIDLKLFFITRANLKAIKDNLFAMNQREDVKQMNSQLEEIRSSETNINKLVIYSFLVYLFCRIPELLCYLHLLFVQDLSEYGFDYYSFCQTVTCGLLINSIHFLYMLTYISNFCFYYKFNKIFRQGVKKMFTKHHGKI